MWKRNNVFLVGLREMTITLLDPTEIQILEGERLITAYGNILKLVREESLRAGLSDQSLIR